nr:RecName: Full=Photosystem I iron-sulfur center; AltName: Full=9 kDa polypeptide; AltName: Full=PSI-C; AltName: Full=Photosystem I subunit VII; AltName: Full=PsaC [Anabaena sp. L-31]
MSHTVKIYD